MTGHLARETFRIAVDGVGYFVVHIAEDIEAMRAELRRCGIEDLVDETWGCCVGLRGEDPQLVGMVLLARGYCGAGVVAHELTHAALRAIERENRTVWAHPEAIVVADASEVEERLCRTVQQLVSQFWDRFYDLGLGVEGQW